MKNFKNYRYSGISFVFISLILQIISVPIIWRILYLIASIFHKQYVCEYCSGDWDYTYKIIDLLFWINIIFTLIIIVLQEYKKSEILTSTAHILWYVFVFWIMYGSLKYRPYEIGLFLFCLGLQIPIRVLIYKKFHI